MIILFFGADDCERCEKAWESLKKHKIHTNKNTVYIDASAEETQDLCDEYNVESLPHIVFIDDNWEVKESVGRFIPPK